MVMMMMMMSTFIAHDSINLNAQCAEGEWGKYRESHNNSNKEKRHTVESHSQNRWGFRSLRNAAKESAYLIVCGRAAYSREKTTLVRLCT